MRILPIFIIWAFVFFLLPKLLGSKKQQKQEGTPNEQNPTTENNELSRTNKDFWRNWGSEEIPMQAEETIPENIQAEPMPSTMVKYENQAAPVEKADTNDLIVKPNAWRGKVSRDAIRRGLIMKEVLGQPRALNPYGKDV
jgi:hypothetical protein